MALHTGSTLDWVRNIATRHEAMSLIGDVIDAAKAQASRLLIGFDFAFGFPRGVGHRLPAGDGDVWQRIWHYLARHISDDANNQNNSYALAAHMNRSLFADCGDGPFWGHPHQHGGRYSGLGPTKDKGAFERVPEFRHVERLASGAKSVWQLAYNGAVGRQSLLGIAHLQQLREHHDVCVWPFETGFDAMLDRRVIAAEIYPSLFDVAQPAGMVLDEAQVRAVAARFAAMDHDGQLRTMMSRPTALDDLANDEVVSQEGWIVGAGHAP